MPKTDTTKIPGPIYAAAGAGDLAIERLRKVPAKVAEFQDRFQTEFPGRVNVLQDKITARVAELPAIVAEFRQRLVDTDTDKLRESARRNAGVARTNAQAAQERAATIYAELVARGTQVVGRTIPGSNDILVAEVYAAPAAAADAAAAKDEVLEGDVTGTPTAKPAKKAAKKATKKS
jgi:heparin binding hemagglutinin HbhA